jgi:hypothetical protein
MTARTGVVAAAVVGLALTVPAVAAAAPPDKLYVDATGVSCSDTAGGAATLPFCTAQAAADVVQPGQTIEITGHAGEMQLEHSGLPGAPIIVEGTGDDDGPGGPGTRDVPLMVMGSHDVVLRNLHIPAHDGWWDAIISNTSQVTFDHNTFGAGSDGGGGLFVVQNNHLTVTRNWIESFGREHVREAEGKGDVIAGNMFGGSGGSGVHLDETTDVALTGNTFVGQCGVAVNITGATSGAHVENNLISQESQSFSAHCTPELPGALNVEAAASSGVTVDYNLVYPGSDVRPYAWAGSIFADATVFAAATGQGRHELNVDPKLDWDNSLLEGSPAIDSANADAPGELGTDFNDAPRVDDPTVPNTGNGIHDRGAQEFQPTARRR